jgi:rifampicin phosphotransferase
MATNAITPRPVTAAEPVFLALGAGSAARHSIGSKASHLDTAASQGMPVPQGYILEDSLWHLALENHFIQVEGTAVTCPDPKAFYEALNLPAFPKKAQVSVRSAFSVEDTPTSSQGRHLAAVNGVDPTKPAALVGALCEVWASSLGYDNTRRDVLVLLEVDAAHAGVVSTASNYEDDVVTYVEGDASALLAGEAEGEHETLRKLRQYEKADHEEGTKRQDATWRDRLQVLLRRLRDTLGDSSWDVAWADDGNVCWLIQAYPVKTNRLRNEVFALGSYKDALTPLPSRYMATLIASTSDELYDWYRQFDADLPHHRPFIENFKGRPYVNLSLLTETLRTLGLPDSLLADMFAIDIENAEGFRLKRAIAKLPSLAQLGMSQLGAVKAAEKTGKAITQRAQNPGSDFKAQTESLRWVYVQLSWGMFNLAQSLSVPMSMLRGTDKLATVLEVADITEAHMVADLKPLREYAQSHPQVKNALANGEIPADPEFKRRWGLYLAKYGYRGIYENDIAQPRYRHNPAPLLEMIVNETELMPAPQINEDELGRVARQAKRLLEAREQLHNDAMFAFDRIRTRLMELAEEAVERGQLPEADALWDMTLEEISLLDVDWTPPPSFFEERRAEIASFAAYKMPDMLRRFDDLEQYRADAAS